MSPEMVELFREIGELTGDSSVGRGLVTCGVAALAAVGVVWQWFRKKKPERTRIWVDAPAGEKVYVQTGEDDE